MSPLLTRRTAASGLLLAVVYVVAAVVTLQFGPLRVRPLYEGVPTAAPYEWVNPPLSLAKGNVKPKPGIVPVAWKSDGNEADSPSAPDAQAFVSFPAHAIAPQPGVDGVDVHFTPLDPLHSPLPSSLPSGLRPDGNAYKITVQYTPTNAAVTNFAKPPIVLLRWATNGTALLYSPDGKQWQRDTKEFQAGLPGDALMSAVWQGNGYYLAASHGPLLPTKSKGGGFPVATVIIGALIVLPIIGIVWFVFPRRAPAAATKPQKRVTKKRR